MSGNLIEVSDSTFDIDVINADKPVLVDFWAPWCGPCVSLTPTIEAIANEQAGKIKVCKLNVDENPNTAAHYGIRGIPTIILFNNGDVINQISGAVPKSNIEQMFAAL